MALCVLLPAIFNIAPQKQTVCLTVAIHEDINIQEDQVKDRPIKSMNMENIWAGFHVKNVVM